MTRDEAVQLARDVVRLNGEQPPGEGHVATDLARALLSAHEELERMAKVEHFGQTGHFCAADKCRFHLHSHVNGYCVSTVGEYYPHVGYGIANMCTLGAAPKSFYETMVFRLVDGDHDGCEIYCRRYADRDEANAGHAAALGEYAAIAASGEET